MRLYGSQKQRFSEIPRLQDEGRVTGWTQSRRAARCTYVESAARRSRPHGRPARVLASLAAGALCLTGLGLTGLGQAGLGLTGLGEAQAAASPDVRVMLSQAAILLLKSELTRRVNGQYRFDPVVSTTDCLGLKGSLRVDKLLFNAKVSSLAIKPAQGRLRVQFYLSLRGGGEVDADRYACGVINATCDLTAQLSNVPVAIDVTPTVSGGTVTVAKTEVKVGIDKHNINLSTAGCGGTGELITNLYKMFEGKVATMLREELVTLAKEEVSKSLGDALSSVSQYSGEAGGLTYAARPTSIGTANGGIGIDAAVNVTAKTKSACPLGAAPGGLPATPPPSIGFEDEHVGLAISKTMLQKAMIEVWRSGLLCLGETEDDSLGVFAANAPNPPLVALEPASDARLKVLFPGVQLTLQTGGAVNATMDLIAYLQMDFDNSSAVVAGEPTIEVRNVEVQSEKEGILDYRALLPELIPELLADKMRDIVLLPRVLARGFGDDKSQYSLYIARARTTEHHIMMFARLHPRNLNDKVGPSTSFEQAPDSWAKKASTFVAAGNDESTPAPLLRYRWRIDGGQWSAPGDTARRTIEFDAGEHRVEVAAVDLSGNADPHPASATFKVDPEPPKIEIVEGPPDPVTESRFSVSLGFQDDVATQDQMRLRVRIERSLEQGEAGENDVWQEVFGGKSTLSLPVLGRGLHTLTVIAEDAAGNRSVPAQTLFESEADAPRPSEALQVITTGGCGVAPAPKPSMLAAWAVLAALFGFETRRRRRPRYGTRRPRYGTRITGGNENAGGSFRGKQAPSNATKG
jgi:MYXO-CTERM domain-containing protein